MSPNHQIIQKIIILGIGVPGENALRHEIVRQFELTGDWSLVKKSVDVFMTQLQQENEKGVVGVVQTMADYAFGVRLTDAQTEELVTDLIARGIDSWEKLFTHVITAVNGEYGTQLSNRANAAELFTDLLTDLKKENDYDNTQAVDAAREWLAGIGASSQSLKAATEATQTLISRFVDNGIQGKVFDGYIADATIFIDENNDNILNPDEISITSDAFGNFLFEGDVPEGQVLISGGTDIATTQSFTGILSAPQGAATFSPLTTLVNHLISNGSASNIVEAEDILFQSLDLPRIDLSVFDPIKIGLDKNATNEERNAAIQVQATTSQVTNLQNVTSALLNSHFTSDTDAALTFSKSLSTILVVAHQQNQTIDLASTETIINIIKETASQSNNTGNIDNITTQTAIILAEINTKTHQASQNNELDTQAALSKIFKIKTLTQTKIITAVKNGLETDDLSTAITQFTGNNLDKNIEKVVAGTLDGTIPVNKKSLPVPDTMAPTLIGSTPVDNATDVAVNNNITLTFSETIKAGTGNIIISDGTDTRTIAVTDATQVNFSGNTVIINPTTDLYSNTTYHLQITSAAITDKAGNSYAGIQDTNTLNFDMTVQVELSAIEQNTNNSGFVINGIDTNDRSGHSVSHAGDVNGDGLVDLIIGAGFDDPNGSNSGASFVVFGKSDGAVVELSNIESATGGFVINGVSTNDQSGRSVSSAGDVNGDGLADLVVGARYDDPNGGDSGASFVIFGKSNGTAVELSDIGSSNNGFVINGVSANDRSGFSVSDAGDVNGDGLDDLIIGAVYDDPNGTNSGASFVVFGKTSATTVELSNIENGINGFVINGISGGDQSGHVVSSAGDVNGDGLADLLLGVPNGDNNGVSFVVFGKSNGTAVELSNIESVNAGFVINGALGGDKSGFSVSHAGDVNGDGLSDLIVGANFADPNGSISGSSFVVFGQTNSVAVELSNIKAGTGGFVIHGVSSGDRSGFSVSSAGDVNGDGLADLIVGAFNDDPNGGDSGASFVVFGKTDGAVVELSNIEAGSGGFVINGASMDDQSGISVSGAGDVNGDGFADLIIGADQDDPNGSNSGASFVVFGGLDTSATIGTSGNDTLTGNSSADQLVAGTGNDLLIGNGGADVLRGGAGDDILAVSDLTFASLDGGTGTDTLRFDAQLNVDLGAIANTHLNNLEIINLNNSGSTLILSTNGILTMVGDEASNNLHINGGNTDSLDLSNTAFFNSGTTETIGTITYDVYKPSAMLNFDDSVHLLVQQDIPVSGARLAPIELSAIEQSNNDSGFVINGISTNDRSGRSVSNVGDINGDGLGDLIVGAYRDDPNGSFNGGASFVVFGKSDGTVVELSTIENGSGGFVVNGMSDYDRSGISVSRAGDVNGDGLTDLIIGAYHDDPNGDNSGASFVVFGKSNGTAIELSNIENGNGGFVINGISENDSSGGSVSNAGDVNGDGFSDLIIGAAYDDSNGGDSGASFVVFGKSDGAAVELSTIESGSGGFVINGISNDDRSGRSVSNAGDVNGDGLADLIIGAPYDSPNGNKSGASFVVFGKSDATAVELSTIENGSGGFVINGVSNNDRSGRSVSNAGDVNGDGLADLIVGAYRDDPNGSFNGGASFVVFGKSDGVTVELSAIEGGSGGFVINGMSNYDRSGISVSSAGDVNGDGLADLIIGAYHDDPNGDRSGASFVVFGKSNGTAVELSDIESGYGGFVINGVSEDDSSGGSVRSAGDVNGDGFSDLIIGAIYDDPNGDDSGASFVVFGGQGTTATIGTNGNDTLTGNSNADQLVAGTGNDTLIGNGGADVLRGGAGDDILAVSDLTFISLNGGTGTDTLRFDTPLNLDLRTTTDTILKNIEVIDLSNDGGNSTISLNLMDVLNLNETQTAADTLVIHGDVGDIVNLDDSSNGQTGTWANAGGGVYEFSAGGIGVIGTVTIDVAISVNII